MANTKATRARKRNGNGKSRSVNKAENGVTLAIFVRLEPKERRALERLGKYSKLPMRSVIARLVVAADKVRTGGGVTGLEPEAGE